MLSGLYLFCLFSNTYAILSKKITFINKGHFFLKKPIYYGSGEMIKHIFPPPPKMVTIKICIKATSLRIAHRKSLRPSELFPSISQLMCLRSEAHHPLTLLRITEQLLNAISFTLAQVIGGWKTERILRLFCTVGVRAY